MKPVKGENGFSLLEITIALMVLTVVLGIAFSLLNRFQLSYRYEEAYADAQRNARFAMARLNEVIRSAGTNPTANTAVNPTDFAVLLSPTTTSGTAVSSSSIQLKSDLNGDTVNSSTVAAGAVPTAPSAPPRGRSLWSITPLGETGPYLSRITSAL